MKNGILATLVATSISAAALINSAWAEPVGIRTLAVQAAHRSATFKALVWYPALPGGSEENVGDNALFTGVPARRDAPLAEGRHPVVVISHGSGGNAANLGWLASELADNGFIVVAPNHPGTTSGDSLQTETVKIWNRPADLSAVLTQVEQDKELGSHIDQNNIGLLGFSLGGHAVLATVGARVDAATYARYCDTNKEPMSECRWLAKGGVDLHKLDAAQFNKSNLDERFTSVVAVDPGLAQAYTRESLEAIKVPALVVNFGRPGHIPLVVDFGERVKAIPRGEYHTVADAIHFSFLGVCKPNAAEILANEGEEDPLCDDGGGRPRKAIHDEITATVLGFLRAQITQ